MDNYMSTVVIDSFNNHRTDLSLDPYVIIINVDTSVC